jgi:hypothetical protein
MHSRPSSSHPNGDDRLSSVKGTQNPTTGRRLAALGAATATFVTVTLAGAGPASAAVPEGWPATPKVDILEMLALLVGIPVGLALLIVAAVYLPGIVRGERVAPGATGPEDQWLGGRRTTGELTGPAEGSGSGADVETTSGGASARW